MFRNLAFGENTLALRLENVLLRKPLSDLRAGYANRILLRPKGAQSTIRCEGGTSKKNRHAIACLFFLRCVDKKDDLLVFIVFYCFAQNYDMHNNSCQYKRYAASI